MNKPIAVHDRRGSFSDRWIEEIHRRNLMLKVVDCYSNQIIEDLSGCWALLWHWDHGQPRDLLVARDIILVAEQMGLKVFPNIDTCWHFDNKLSQKYALGAIGAPLADTYIFFDKEKAMEWARESNWPMVFKLRRGAGSINVKLVRTRYQAQRIIERSFGRGHTIYGSPFTDISAKFRRTASAKKLFEVLPKLPARIMKLRKDNKLAPRERGYAYFQEFLPNNDHDTRVTIIGNRAFAFRRSVRFGDFRASGSGLIDHARNHIDIECVKIALEAAKRLGSQSMAFDFAYDGKRHPRILEMSYAYAADAVFKCPGYWDDRLKWYGGHIWPQDAILDDLLNSPRHRAWSWISESGSR